MVGRLRIDDLAREAGITTRNIRAYQDKGLLPPPVIVGRTGWYDEGHLARLRVINRLLGRGFSLAAIGDLLASYAEGRDLADVLGFEAAVLGPYTDEEPAHLSADELATRFGDAPPELGERAVALGLIEPTDDGWLVPSPAMLDAAELLVEAGYPIEALLEEGARLQSEAAEIARRFLDLWETYVWGPVQAAGAQPEAVARAAELTERSRLVPAIVMRGMIAAAMREEADRRLARALSGSAGGTTDDAAPRPTRRRR